MTPSLALAIASLTALTTGTAALALLLPVLQHRQIMDVPNHRSSHTAPTVRGGGLGIVIALAVGLVIGAALSPIDTVDRLSVCWFAMTVLAFAAVGWTEDLRGLSIRTRLGFQVTIAASAAMGALWLGEIPLALASLGAVGGVFYVNAANFMDGINGISSWHGIVTGSYFAAIGLVSDSMGLALAGAVTAAAFLSFLPWNAPQARMFMGDVGSYALGAAAWALCVYALMIGTPLTIAVVPLAVYAGDVVFTLVRRARRRAPLFEAHREHVYQRLQQLTNSHQVASGIVTAATAACTGFGLLGSQSDLFQPWALLPVSLVVVVYLATPSLIVWRRTISESSEATR